MPDEALEALSEAMHGAVQNYLGQASSVWVDVPEDQKAIIRVAARAALDWLRRTTH